MKPDRNNYESWFIDCCDGILSDQQAGILKEFLAENPDLQEEFDALSVINLKPKKAAFAGKDRLIKTSADISSSDFEYLCVAHLENDLNPEQASELLEIISSDSQKRKTFELFRKTRLTPPSYVFSKKNQLKKVSPVFRIIRLASIGLSAAAAIALLIVTNFALPSHSRQTTHPVAQRVITDTIKIETPSAITEAVPDDLHSYAREKTYSLKRTDKTAALSDTGAEKTGISQTAPPVAIVERVSNINRLEVTLPADIPGIYSHPEFALASFTTLVTPPDFEDDMSNVDRFVARFFHKTVLKDTVMVDRPLEKYEIAAAGIQGLNKLFGWEMALQRNTDENGDIRSLSFNSKYLKFKTPVKKREDAL